MANGKVGRPKGLPKYGGRAPGTPNKITKQLKDMILEALDNAGGAQYLTEQAQKNPKAFLALLGRVLPTTLQGTDGGAIVVSWQSPE